MGNTTIPEFDISQVAGNAPDHIKRRLGDIPSFDYGAKTRSMLNTFGKAIELRLKLTELSIISKAEEPNKLEGRAVLEIDVAEGKRKLIITEVLWVY
jgi:acyl-coenzyme A thioesterase 13